MASILETYRAVSFGRTYLLDALSRVTHDMLDFRPLDLTDGRLYSLREQFLHIADIGEMFIHHSILGQEMPGSEWRIQRAEDGSWSLARQWPTVASVREELERSWAFQDEHVFNRSSAHLIDTELKDGRNTLAGLVGWLICHESQHRGQVMMYLRMAGVEPPDW